MKIENQPAKLSVENAKNQALQKAKQATQSLQATLNTPKDSISSTQYLALQRTIENTPEVDADKVAELRSKIKQGTYSLSPKDLAGSILKKSRQEDLV